VKLPVTVAHAVCFQLRKLAGGKTPSSRKRLPRLNCSARVKFGATSQIERHRTLRISAAVASLSTAFTSTKGTHGTTAAELDRELHLGDRGRCTPRPLRPREVPGCHPADGRAPAAGAGRAEAVRAHAQCTFSAAALARSSSGTRRTTRHSAHTRRQRGGAARADAATWNGSTNDPDDENLAMGVGWAKHSPRCTMRSMIKDLPKPNTQALSWFYGEDKKQTLLLSPKYQRNPISPCRRSSAVTSCGIESC
jgi:hypothetical protein